MKSEFIQGKFDSNLWECKIIVDQKELLSEEAVEHFGRCVSWGFGGGSSMTTAVLLLKYLYKPNSLYSLSGRIDTFHEFQTLLGFLDNLPQNKNWGFESEDLLKKIFNRTNRIFRGKSSGHEYSNQVTISNASLLPHLEIKRFSNWGFGWGNDSPETDQLVTAIMGELFGAFVFESKIREFELIKKELMSLPYNKPWEIDEYAFRAILTHHIKSYKGIVDHGCDCAGIVTVDDRPLWNCYYKRPSDKVRFGWGFGGGGPRQLSESLAADVLFTGSDLQSICAATEILYEYFVQTLPHGNWQIDSQQLHRILCEHDSINLL